MGNMAYNEENKKFDPNKKMKVAIKSNSRGHYWCATNQDEYKVKCSTSKIDGLEIFETLPLAGDNQVALISCQGKYLQIKLDNDGCGIHARADVVKSWETFTLCSVDANHNLYAIKCANGKFISSSKSGWILGNGNDLKEHQIFGIIPVEIVPVPRKQYNVEEKLQQAEKAGYDPATNLPMKSIMYPQLIAACNKNLLNIAVCSADMDGMKQLNDSLGHHITDNIIKSIADIMANHAKDNEFISVYRMNAGGDEFGMIIKDTNNKLVVEWADGLRKEIDNSTKATISIGVAMRKNKETKDQWFKRAEDALMKTKKKGKNMVVLDA